MNASTFTRRERPLAALHRARWSSLLQDPSRYAYLLSASGKATQRQFLSDIASVMDYLVSELELRTRKVGVATRRGFLLRTWANVAEGTGLPIWRVKQCVSFAKQRGWLTSTQPRHNENGEWYGLASIKRITERYFADLGLTDAMLKARAAASNSIKRMASRTGVHVRYLLTPITLLRKFARRHDQSPLKR
ncbi:hypothetical protein HOO69_15460 (plasmid) [Vibrio europaeus]|uniref:Uncharacterized protein n=1 Tax=Vibrio europaeus TaxID=300876 RepID=A0AAE7DY81_9VIBR|nr:hypothetical protein [Vibrio europaeus]QJY37988.1 hypothetical protein HOO69_15460 [Vibrio europaeus]